MAPFSLYDRMKTMFLRGLLIVVLCVGCAESQRGEFVPQSEEFKTFLEKFPEQNTPINKAGFAPADVWGINKMTDYESGLWERYLSETEVDKFIKGRIPIDMQSICYLGCMAGARVKSKMLPNDDFVLLLIVKDNELGCGEEDILVVYNSQGEVVDYLVIYGNYEESDIPSLRTSTSYNPYFFHSKIEDDSISILKVELFFITENGTDKLYKTVYTKRKYVISDAGKFVMTSEEVTEKKE